MALPNKSVDLLNELSEPENVSEVTARIQEQSNVRSSKVAKGASEKTRDEIQRLTPSISDSTEPGPVSIQDAIKKQKKIRELISKIDQVDSTIDSISSMIKKHTKNYNVQIDISNKPPVKKAVKKIFRKNLKYIDKEMYLYAVSRLQELQNSKVDEELQERDF